MSYSVTIEAGLENVVLPNGNLYNAGDVVILTDEQYGVIPAATRAAVFSAEAIIPVPAS